METTSGCESGPSETDADAESVFARQLELIQVRAEHKD